MMTFTNREYISWRPNKAFMQYFENMKKRRVPASDGSSARVTNTSPPSSENNEYRKKKRKMSPKTPTASDIMVTTAKAQMGYKNGSNKKRSIRHSKKRKGSTKAQMGYKNGGSKKRSIKPSKKRKGGASLERRLRQAKL